MKKSRKVAKKAPTRTRARSAAKPAAPAKKPARKSRARTSWLDSSGTVPLIDTHARKLRSFVQALADGVVDDAEVAAQERRLVELMKQVEPQLDGPLHAQVTELLCELTAYDIMRLLREMHAARPRHVFRG